MTSECIEKQSTLLYVFQEALTLFLFGEITSESERVLLASYIKCIQSIDLLLSQITQQLFSQRSKTEKLPRNLER